jgi:hypothetical protein
MELALIDVVLEPVKYHIHHLSADLLDGAIGDAYGFGIVDLLEGGGRRLFVA